MSNWQILSGELLELYSPVGLRLIDQLTEQSPIGDVRAQLEITNGTGGWKSTTIKASRSASGLLIYPGLERRAQVIGILPRRYRVQLIARFYTPLYRMNAEGIEFEAFPYNDAYPPTDYRINPPQEVTPQAQDVKLVPAVNYPFQNHIRVLHGKVTDLAGKAMADVEVKRSNKEMVLSDKQGGFALPLYLTPNGVAVPVKATDHRTGRTGTINITLPQALSSSQTITI